MPNPWFKFYAGEYLSDTKILILSASERSCWVTLLCLACQNEGKPLQFLSEKQLLLMSGVSEEIEIFKKFEELGLVTICNGLVTVKNWEKRQLSEGALRVRNFRKRQGNGNDNDRVDKSRVDKIREEEILPTFLNKKAWEAWKQHRKEKGKKLTPTSIKLQLKFLEANQKDHVQIIKNSITNGWTGLFEIKENITPRTAYQRKADIQNDERERNENANHNEKVREVVNLAKGLSEKFKVA